MYANGRGIARDDALAASLFALAAEQGHVAAARGTQIHAREPGRLPDCMLPDEPVVGVGPQEEAADPFVDLPPEMQKIARMVKTLAPAYTVSPRLALAVITVESNFDPKARSPKDARGLMQLIPDTATRFRVKNASMSATICAVGWPIWAGCCRITRARSRLRPPRITPARLPSIVPRHPAYPETRNYVQRVLVLYGSERHPYDPSLAAPSELVTAR